ncbi:MAG: RNA polymerase sporulation sigma factor SigK [Clostridia bacterium]|nr:RNA polymerase sporulation sigma factor SigK [Clostridia bacterium]
MLAEMLMIFLRVDDINSFPQPLTAQEEADCFRLMRQGDEKAREKLILHNLRLVAHIVKKYYTACDSQDDLISIGTIGLIKAIDSFSVENGTRFATYAGKCLQNEILMYFRSQKKLQNEVSINETIDVDKDGNPLTYIDIISSDDTIADDLFVKMSSKRVKKIIENELDERERRIIVLRYGLSGEKALTQREVAVKLGISRSYVSRIEKNALEKISEHLKHSGIL